MEKRENDDMVFFMEDKTEAIKIIKHFWKDDSMSTITKEELNILRRYERKLNWLVDNMKTNLNSAVREQCMKTKKEEREDLKEVNHVKKRLKDQENKVIYKYVDDKYCIIVKE
jgi:hypothetical protein